MGAINKFGLDIGATNQGPMVLGGFCLTSRKAGILAGNFAGLATVVTGLGANALVGGSDRTVSVQPVSVQGLSDVNLAVGVSGLQLRAAR